MRGKLPRDAFRKDLELRSELLILRAEKHWNFSELGRHFGTDHTTIRYNLARFAPELLTVVLPVSPRIQYLLDNPHHDFVPEPEPPPPPPMKYGKYIDEDSYPVTNPGKLYKEYRKVSRQKSKEAGVERRRQLRAEFNERVKKRGRLVNAKGYLTFRNDF